VRRLFLIPVSRGITSNGQFGIIYSGGGQDTIRVNLRKYDFLKADQVPVVIFIVNITTSRNVIFYGKTIRVIDETRSIV
jgi:hypothetical protein